MKLTQFFREELDREVERSRKALEQVPDGKYQWKPHDKSMIFGYLADMVATIPTWITMEINRDELDIAPAEGAQTVCCALQDAGAALYDSPILPGCRHWAAGPHDRAYCPNRRRIQGWRKSRKPK